MTHLCHAQDCARPCRPEKLMCRPCWDLVPGHLKVAVLRTYRPGQCDDKRPSREWIHAAKAAIQAVADLRSAMEEA